VARKRYRQSRRNAVIQWTLPLVLMIVIVLIQTRVEREIGWMVFLAVLGFMVWFSVLYEKSRNEEGETGRQEDSEADAPQHESREEA
jgi:positive regulator of sigma E activity